MKRFWVLIIVILLTAVKAGAAQWEESPKVEAVFNNAKVTGTFVLYDVGEDKLLGYNKARAETQYIPASTFKIPNSLIGLCTGSVKSVDEIIPYKGPEKPFIQKWAKDMSLRDAIGLSNIYIYMELARRVGLKKMKESVNLLHYGNRNIGPAVDQFWLEGPLEISAVEQVRFLADLARNKLDFPIAHQKSVQDITVLEKKENRSLHGKTGWQNAPGAGIGWWVGWVEKEGHIYAFALNMDMKDSADAPKRIEIGKACLKALGIY